jgi:hypothetical protein
MQGNAYRLHDLLWQSQHYWDMVNKPWIPLKLYLPTIFTFMGATWASWTRKTSQTAEVASGIKLSGQ